VNVRRALLSPEACVFAICAIFIAISAWWLANDVRMVNTDNAKHLLIAARWQEVIRDGDLFAPFTEWAQYPPGVHLVGALAIALFGVDVSAIVLFENVVFVPLLAFGCYGTAQIAYGRQAGVLAALFAFSVPMVMSMFHVFMLDVPTTAMAALTVWLLLASDRFARADLAAAAGLAAGLGMYMKGTFFFFFLGVAGVMFLRAGWRNWKGVLAFGIVAGAISLPWYIGHLADLRGQTAGAVGAGGAAPSIWYGSVSYPERESIANFTWYGWNLVNHQLWLPLTLFFLAGAGWAARRFVKAPRLDDYFPELLVGGLIGYLGVSWIVLKDPRYSLPCLVFVAVLGTAWIPSLPRRWRIAAIAALVGVFVVNTANLNFGVGGTQVVKSPWTVASPLGEYSLTVLRDSGYIEGGPSKSAEPFVNMLDAAHASGITGVVIDSASFSTGGYHIGGMTLLVTRTKLGLPGYTRDLVRKPTDAWVVRLPIAEVRHRPCASSFFPGDGTGIYLYRGRAPKDPGKVAPDCPARA
jgi:4-amino-4-deoxy-L-arabinose transferase-like glycosyltransferase